MLQTSNFTVSTYFFPALFISGIHKVPGLTFKGGPGPASRTIISYTMQRRKTGWQQQQLLQETKKEAFSVLKSLETVDGHFWIIKKVFSCFVSFLIQQIGINSEKCIEYGM